MELYEQNLNDTQIAKIIEFKPKYSWKLQKKAGFRKQLQKKEPAATGK